MKYLFSFDNLSNRLQSSVGFLKLGFEILLSAVTQTCDNSHRTPVKYIFYFFAILRSGLKYHQFPSSSFLANMQGYVAWQSADRHRHQWPYSVKIRRTLEVKFFCETNALFTVWNKNLIIKCKYTWTSKTQFSQIH